MRAKLCLKVSQILFALEFGEHCGDNDRGGGGRSFT